MNNADFWASINAVIKEGFTSEGLQKLYAYAEDFISGRLVYKRFSPLEQHGCSAGGFANVIATLLAGAEVIADCEPEKSLTEYQRECKRGAQQEKSIEQWTRAEGIWIEPVDDSLQQLLGVGIAEGGEAVVLCSANGTVFVIDCDIRINTPDLRQGGVRKLTTEVVYD